VVALFTAVCADAEVRGTANREGVEGVIYEVRKFFRLASECNPNILESLFCADRHVLYCSDVGEQLRERADEFLSGKAKHTFCGYAMAQLSRIKTHKKWLMEPPPAPPERADFGLPERRLIPKSHQQELAALVQKKLDEWEPDLSPLEPADRRIVESRLRRILVDALGEDPWPSAARLVGLQDDVVAVMQRERSFQSARTNWKQYANWKKNRNEARAELEAKHGYDTKHAMHLMRLLRMGLEIVERGEVRVDRTNIDADELLDIRRGALAYDELIAQSDALLAQVSEAYDARYVRHETSPSVPPMVDVAALDSWCTELVTQQLRSTS
jgi:predicted nucleotidyltransferase